jgi:mRNA interferase RelE/StbE
VDGYRLSIKPSAAKEIKTISNKTTLARIIERIQALSAQPRPHGSEKLAGKVNLYRVRQGNFRILYSVDDETRTIDVIKVGHRSDVYR